MKRLSPPATLVLGLMLATPPLQARISLSDLQQQLDALVSRISALEDHHPEIACGDTALGLATGMATAANGTVDQVFVQVDETWLDQVPVTCPTSAGDGTEGEVSLDISIAGENGTTVQHGSQLVPLSATSVLASGSGQAEVVVDWTTDAEPGVPGETYTICVQVVFPSGPAGDLHCTDFGLPF